MSRLAKKPIAIPSGVEVKFENGVVHVKGPKGSLEQKLVDGITLTQEGSDLTVAGTAESKFIGLSWALVRNMVLGTSAGFEKHLQMIGVGYRAIVQGSEVEMQVGYSNPRRMAIPQGISVKVDKNTELTISGTDKQQVGQFAADLRALRPPEPYKGKGVRYRDEYVRRKAGKAKSK